MYLRANRDFFDVATGRHYIGECFDEPRPKVATQLIRRNLCSPLTTPSMAQYETKIVLPAPQVAAPVDPFQFLPAVQPPPCDVPVPDDPEPPALVAVVAATVAAADVPKREDRVPVATKRGRGRPPGSKR